MGRQSPSFAHADRQTPLLVSQAYGEQGVVSLSLSLIAVAPSSEHREPIGAHRPATQPYFVAQSLAVAQTLRQTLPSQA